MLGKIKKLLRSLIIKNDKQIKYTGFHSDIMPEIRPISEETRVNPKFTDLTGTTKGKLVVLGLSPARRHWVVRCRCGKYETRTSRALKNMANIFDCCCECQGRAVSESRAHFVRTGVMLGTEFFLKAMENDHRSETISS